MAAGVALSAGAYSRLPTILLAHYGPEQKQAAAEFEAARKILVAGPFVSLMYSPQVMTQARALGDPLRYESAMGTALSELAILLTAQKVDSGLRVVRAPADRRQGGHSPGYCRSHR